MARPLIRYSTDHLISHACLASARVRLLVLNSVRLAAARARIVVSIGFQANRARRGPEGATMSADWSRHGLTGPQQ